MQGRILLCDWWSRVRRHHQLRLMVSKPPNRSAVHGARLPVLHHLNEEVEKEISKGKEEKQNRRKEVEKAVDSQLNQSKFTYYTPLD
uniref:Uncharacterized protein n=1 Tax=Cannabis sativa TaxID=3483 RepID=A0A803NYH4_CANSA